MRYVVAFFTICFCLLSAGEFDKVKITPDISYIYVYHKGKAVIIHRIQDTKHKLTGEYSKTYRPKSYIQPIKQNSGVQTIGEDELLEFMQQKVNRHKGLVVDVRSREDYAKESIPSAVNIPIEILSNDKATAKLFKVLKMRRGDMGKWDGTNALYLAIYCHGLWCKKSSDFIDKFVRLGYPRDKLLYYRGGFQMWKILGLTTVKN